MSLCFEQIFRGPVLGTFSTESVRSGKALTEQMSSGSPPKADVGRRGWHIRLGPILLKKSVEAVDQIFLASWVKFATKCAEDRMLRRRRDVCRSKWDYEADNSRS